MSINLGNIKNVEKLAANVPESLERTAQLHGLHKIAAARYGVPEINEETVAKLIGTKLASRMAEWRNIRAGVSALKDIK